MRWLGILLSKLLMWPYSLVMWFPAWIFRSAVRENWYNGGRVAKWTVFPLWIVLDDENDYGEAWWIDQNGYGSNWRTAWIWSWARNNSWNWNQFVRVHRTGKEECVKCWSNDGKDPLLHRRFKWEYKQYVVLEDERTFPEHFPDLEFDGNYYYWAGDWNTNQGDRLSQYRTWLGAAYARYTVRGTRGKFWRFSYAGIWANAVMVNVKAGFNKRGETLLDLKLKRFKKVYTAHWE